MFSVCVPVCVSLYETVTGSLEGEIPYHWYTDQRFHLFIMCLIFILPLSIPKEIGIQKYTRCVGWSGGACLCVLKIGILHGYSDSLFPLSFFDSLTLSVSLSVLGTLAATYLCVAVIVKYYMMDEHSAVITPEHSEGSVSV